ncbi:hypothetical protein SVAN01_03784 [Stagonosporopsis vannaccii]|nr:hypothetical protein SVAN01_03784 [Stagonosporopsis vannaccii]
MFPTSFKKVVRTYSRQTKRPLYDEEPPTKRRRVERAESASSPSTTPAHRSPVEPLSPARVSSAPLSSSPQPSLPTSDPATRSSPPSSPALQSSPPPDSKRRPVFSLFRRKLKHSISAPEVLSERNQNAQSPPKPLPPKKKRMVQMQLDLVGQHRKACKTCGMEYIPSSAEDAALHKKFHAMNFGGVDCTKAMVERLRQKQIWNGGEGSFIAVVGRRDALALRNKASDVLKVVNTELAAVSIDDEDLWSQTTFAAMAESSENDASTTGKCDRFKVYLYIRGQKCVAACVAERIREAFTVLAQDQAAEQQTQTQTQTLDESQSSSISVSTAADTVLLGISRIWVSNQFRKQGLARKLLDCTRSDFMYGMTVEKRLTAFSQPTESGGKLARKYFESEAGWHVLTTVTEQSIRTFERLFGRKLNFSKSKTNQYMRLPPVTLLVRHGVMLGCTGGVCCGMVGLSSLSLQICARAIGGCDRPRRTKHQQLQQRQSSALHTPLHSSFSLSVEQCIVYNCAMSSGNPFRTSVALNQAPSSRTSVISSESRRPEVGTQDDDVPAHTVSPPPRTKKHVRIESTAISIPPQPDISSPDDSPRTLFAPQPAAAQYAGSQPPASSAAYSNSSPSPGAYTREPGRSYDMAAPDSLGSSNSASGRGYPALSPSGVPANPFAKTLASMEPSRAGGEDREGAAQGSNSNNRASLDVESFKNMLLTGRPYPRQATQAPQPPIAPNSANAAVVESGSSTDASSISRQSLLEPAQEAPTESPRTSYEMARSDEDSVAGLTPERTRSKRKPPPAPASRHGKLVSPRQPQTVSFDSFAATEVASSPVTRSRNTSDTSKPLPPTPIPSSQPPSINAPAKTWHATSPSAENVEEPLSRSNSRQKRPPPPVPLARRQSQLRHSSAEQRSRSSSSLTLSSQHSSEVPASTASPTPGEIASNATAAVSTKSPPPPPPSRRGARLSDMGASSANSSSTELPQRSTSVRTTGSSRGPSSRRSTLDDEPEPPASRTSSKRNSRIVSTESPHTGMPPPPPPPRRRPGSNRSSLDQPRPSLAALATSSPPSSRRTSTDLRRTSLDHNRRASGASEHSLRHEYVPADDEGAGEYALYSPREEAEDKLAKGDGEGEERKDSNNILEDMEKFQREIDELRNRYKQAG